MLDQRQVHRDQHAFWHCNIRLQELDRLWNNVALHVSCKPYELAIDGGVASWEFFFNQGLEHGQCGGFHCSQVK